MPHKTPGLNARIAIYLGHAQRDPETAPFGSSKTRSEVIDILDEMSGRKEIREMTQDILREARLDYALRGNGGSHKNPDIVLS